MVEMSLDKLGSGIETIHAAPAGRREQPLPTIFSFMVTLHQKRCTRILAMRWLRLDFG